MAELKQSDLAALNASLEERTPQEILKWAVAVFEERLAILSAMQKAGSVVCHMASSAGFKLPVLFVDTGVHFAETLATRDRISQEYGLEVISLTPELTMEEQTEKFGILYLNVDGQLKCCDMRKTQPLLAAKGRFDGLVGSLRRGDGERRSNLPILAIDRPMNCLRVNILANFENDQMRDYIASNAVIVNPLHHQGYSTIGCNRCTTPVLPDEPKRAGRWRHLGPWAMYCGINPTDVRRPDSESVDLPVDLVDRLLGRKVDFAI
ncbi:MAG: phosphoadenylyl-sulfate reductase [Planctomycetaceae bacterium]|nr:MAG: phosphoadenylyl-sulfate reductase [Planctomycetaceae bacterium]